MDGKWYSGIVTGWSAGRIVKTLAGAALAVGGWLAGESFFVALGAWLLLQGVLNLSCCGSGGCGVQGDTKQLYKDDIKTYRPQK